MNRAAFALRNGTMPTMTFARSNSPRARIRSAHRGQRLDVVRDLRHDHVGAGVELRLQPLPGRTGRRAAGRPPRSGTAADRRSRARTSVVPSSRIRFASPTTSCTERSFTTVASGWSPIVSGSPVRQSRLRAPSAHAPSRSAVMRQPVPVAARELHGRLDARLRDESHAGERRHVRARGGVVRDVRGVDVADQRARVLGHRRHRRAERGGTTSPVTANRPDTRMAASRPPVVTGRTPAPRRRRRCSPAASRSSSGRHRRAPA